MNPEAILAGKGGRVLRLADPAPVAPPDFSNDMLALAFSGRFVRRLLFVPEWGHWLQWDGTRWERDRTLGVFNAVRTVCREHAARAAYQTRGTGRSFASAATVAAVEKLARSDRRHVRDASLFDADAWALNTPGGIIDLRTGALRKQRPEDLVTKITAAAPGGDCPKWRAFIAEIIQGDAEAAAYLQRWAGYMLTGETREHAFLFLYGPGGNGKSVFVNTLAAALGDYATTAPMETFMASAQDRHPTDLADLRGARLVLAQETEAGRVLAEARLKALTGGDAVKARFMRQDFFEYRPAFKLVMVGNHKPVVRNPDEAMRRRLHLLPITFKPTRPDHTLADRLRAELPGILAWAVEGCAMWQRDGLGIPEVVANATRDYFAEQDLIAQWLAERCEVQRDAAASSAAMFQDWKAWAEARGEQAGTNKAFSAGIERHHAKRKTNQGAEFLGLRLRPSDKGVW